MFTVIFLILIITIFGKLLSLALRAAWGLTKIFFSIILLPLILVGLLFKGFVIFAVVGLIVAGVIALVGTVTT